MSAAGVLNSAGTQNVSVVHEAGGSSDYCLTVSSQPHTGVASVDLANGGNGFATVWTRPFTPGEKAVYVGLGCADSTNAIVRTYNNTGSLTVEPFFVAFFN